MIIDYWLWRFCQWFLAKFKDKPRINHPIFQTSISQLLPLPGLPQWEVVAMFNPSDCNREEAIGFEVRWSEPVDQESLIACRYCSGDLMWDYHRAQNYRNKLNTKNNPPG